MSSTSIRSSIRIYRQLAGSPTIDAGSNEQVPGNVLVDLDGNARFRDDPATPDTGSGQAPLVDLGAFEFQPATPLQFRGRRRR